MINSGHIKPNWDTEKFKDLTWCSTPFNDSSQYTRWIREGYRLDNTVGSWIDITSPEFPSDIKNTFSSWNNLNDIGLTLYRMKTSEILPVHFDTYSFYKKIFKLDDKEVNIYRTLVMLEDWKSGHYLEVDGTPFLDWKAGDWFVWSNDTPHMAANIGIETRYTLQITGWSSKLS